MSAKKAPCEIACERPHIMVCLHGNQIGSRCMKTSNRSIFWLLHNSKATQLIFMIKASQLAFHTPRNPPMSAWGRLLHAGRMPGLPRVTKLRSAIVCERVFTFILENSYQCLQESGGKATLKKTSKRFSLPNQQLFSHIQTWTKFISIKLEHHHWALNLCWPCTIRWLGLHFANNPQLR